MTEEKATLERKLKDNRDNILAATGRTIVSASAGAGKTTIMIEKICRYLEDGGDLDKILAITYTKKAASELKQRLHDRLSEKIQENLSRQSPDGDDTAEKLKVQLDKLSTADIGTIHSFCAKLIRRYYFVLGKYGLDSNFEISTDEDARTKFIAVRVLDDLLEKKYADSDDTEFGYLVKCLNKRTDEELRKYVVNEYEKIRYFPDYREKLEKYKDMYTENGFEDAYKGLYEHYKKDVFNPFVKKITDFHNANKELIDGDENCLCKVFKEVETTAEKFLCSGSILCENLPEKIVPEYNQADSKWTKTKIKDIVSFLKILDNKSAYIKNKSWLYVKQYLKNRETERKQFMSSGKIAIAFCDLLKEYDSAFTEAKCRENVLDFADLEHFALDILRGNEPESTIAGLHEDILDHVRGKYEYIFVDEYQDVNPVQDSILECLSSDNSNSFYVGDMKQAIYGFRGSNSDFFIAKRNEYGKADDKNTNVQYLSHNFRSAKKIIDAVNKIFGGTVDEDSTTESPTYAAMNSGIYTMEYREKDMLLYGGKYADDARGRVEVDYYTKESNATGVGGEFPVYSVKEAATVYSGQISYSAQGNAIASVIDEEIKNGKIYEKNGSGPRGVRYGDICILTRKGVNDEIVQTINYLREKGYPISTVKSADVKDDCDVRCLMDTLSCVDNPEQDVPLCTFLLSPLGGFTEDDLVKIRIAKEFEGTHFKSFCDMVRKYSDIVDDELTGKIKDAYEKLDGYRDFAEIAGAGTLIDKICEDAGWYLQFEKQRGVIKEKINALQSRAFKAGGEISLPDFLRNVDRDDIEIGFSEPSDSDCIHVMTMHSAKGLEFPIVIISDVAAKFNKNNTNSDCITFDDKFGFAPEWYDDGEAMKKGGTIWKTLIEEKQKKEEIKNELNLFYVACTRAEYSLHIMNSDPKPFKGPTESVSRYDGLVDFPSLTGYVGNGGNTDADSDEKYVSSYRVLEYTEPKPVILSGEYDESLYDRLKDAFDKTRNPMHGEDIPLYVLPSDQSEAGEKEYTDEDGKSVRAFVAVPQTKEKGTAYHKFLEVCDFSKKSRSEIEAEINELDVQTAGLLRDETDNLKDLLSMPVFSDVPGDCYRERKFSCFLSARDIIDGADSDDEVYVDGVIDFMTVEGDKIRIVDYKYSGRSDEDLRAKYSRQLKIYRLAVFKMFGGKIPMENISTTLINIYTKRVVPLDA